METHQFKTLADMLLAFFKPEKDKPLLLHVHKRLNFYYIEERFGFFNSSSIIRSLPLSKEDYEDWTLDCDGERLPIYNEKYFYLTDSGTMILTEERKKVLKSTNKTLSYQNQFCAPITIINNKDDYYPVLFNENLLLRQAMVFYARRISQHNQRYDTIYRNPHTKNFFIDFRFSNNVAEAFIVSLTTDILGLIYAFYGVVPNIRMHSKLLGIDKMEEEVMRCLMAASRQGKYYFKELDLIRFTSRILSRISVHAKQQRYRQNIGENTEQDKHAEETLIDQMTSVCYKVYNEILLQLDQEDRLDQPVYQTMIEQMASLSMLTLPAYRYWSKHHPSVSTIKTLSFKAFNDHDLSNQMAYLEQIAKNYINFYKSQPTRVR